MKCCPFLWSKTQQKQNKGISIKGQKHLVTKLRGWCGTEQVKPLPGLTWSSATKVKSQPICEFILDLHQPLCKLVVPSLSAEIKMKKVHHFLITLWSKMTLFFLFYNLNRVLYVKTGHILLNIYFVAFFVHKICTLFSFSSTQNNKWRSPSLRELANDGRNCIYTRGNGGARWWPMVAMGAIDSSLVTPILLYLYICSVCGHRTIIKIIFIKVNF